MGNKCWNPGKKGKKSARIANATHGSDRDGSLIHSERSNPNKVVKINGNENNAGRLLISKGDFINEHTSENIREDYQIGKVLGTGAFGEVRVCTHRKSNIKRAVKILKKNFLKEEEQK